MTAARRLTSLQVAGFVADGALRFDGIVPRALSDAALAELAGGGPSSPFGADASSPAAAWAGRPLAGLFRDWPALTAVLELPAVAGIIAGLLGPDPIYDHHYAHVIAPRRPAPSTTPPSWSTSSCSRSWWNVSDSDGARTRP